MSRGRFWEITFDPDDEGPDTTAYLDTDGTSGLISRRVVTRTDDETTSVNWRRRNGEMRSFQKCDFHLKVHNSHLSNCTFVGCRFSGSHWSQVHFSNCSFKECDFSNATFEDCYFVDDCTFSTISASAQLLKIRDTALSARAFIGNLVTNVDHLPTSVTKEYQLWRHVGTKAKIAKMIFAANKDQAEIAYYFEAYEQLTRCILDQEVEKHHFTADEKPTRRMLFLAKSLPARIERRLVLAAGWLTLWGRSLLRPLVFFAGCIIVFGLLYYCQSATAQAGASNVARARSAVIEAFNITIVAGYTAHYASTASGLRQMTWLLNIACGLFWYSLVIPVISRRILR